MWTACPQVLDEPITKWGFELDDVLILGIASAVAMILLHVFVWLVATVVAFASAYYGKRGKPPGAILHWLHAHELIPWYWLSLPGCVPARSTTYSPW